LDDHGTRLPLMESHRAANDSTYDDPSAIHYDNCTVAFGAVYACVFDSVQFDFVHVSPPLWSQLGPVVDRELDDLGGAQQVRAVNERLRPKEQG
jgi:hypothetical protein